MLGISQERKIFDEKFIRLDTRRLCELTSAADALAMKPLVDLTSRALARLIEGKTPEQVHLRPCRPLTLPQSCLYRFIEHIVYYWSGRVVL